MSTDEFDRKTAGGGIALEAWGAVRLSVTLQVYEKDLSAQLAVVR